MIIPNAPANAPRPGQYAPLYHRGAPKTTVFRDRDFVNVTYEGFSSEEGGFAASAWRLLCGVALQATLRYDHSKVERWFGIYGAMRHTKTALIDNLQNMAEAIRRHPITLVYRGDVFGDTVFVDDGEGLQRQEVWATGRVFSHRAGSGYRIILNADSGVRLQHHAKFLRTVYHELTHKHIDTDDVVNEQGEPCYGVERAQMLAFDYPEKAIQNADNYGLFVASLVLHPAAEGHGMSLVERSQHLERLDEVARRPTTKLRDSYDTVQLELMNQFRTENGEPDWRRIDEEARKVCDPDTIPK